MRRTIAVLAGLAGLIGVVGSAAAAGSPGAPSAPDKTVGPTSPTTSPATAPGGGAPPSSVPPLGTSPGVPTLAPPTSAWLDTTTTMPLPTTSGVTQPTVAPTAPSAVAFDGVSFLTELYGAVNGDPLTLIDIAADRTILNSTADLFIAHLLGETMTHRLHGGTPPPLYTVTAAGKGVSVCASTGACDMYGDFYAPTGLLETFSINGVAIDDSLAVTRRPTVVESLSVDTTLCFLATDTSLSCIVLMTSEGAATALSFDQAVFTALDGRQFVPDLAQSAFAPSITDGGFGSAHLVFVGAPLEGELTFPVVSGISGTPSVASVPVRAL